MQYIKWFLTGEVLFAAFITSSVFKAFFSIPIDLTFVFMLLTVTVAIKRVYEKRMSIPKLAVLPILLYATLAIFMIISLTYTTTEFYSTDKVFRFITLTAWTFLGVFFLIRDKESLRRFFSGLLFFSVTVALFSLKDYFSGVSIYENDRLGVEGGNVLGLGRVTGMSLILISVLYVYTKTTRTVKFIAMLGLFVTLTTLILTGSRMPFISALLSVILLLPLSFKLLKGFYGIKVNKRIFAFLGIIIPFVTFFFIVAREESRVMFARLGNLMSSTGNDQSAAVRSQLLDTSKLMFFENPIFGEGIGSFPMRYANIDTKIYTHNIFFELISELGLIGILLFILLLVYAAYIVLKFRKKSSFNIYQISVILVSVFYLINATSTGDINDNRTLFCFLGLMTMIPFYKDINVSNKQA